MDDSDDLDGYINNTLAQKFSDLTFDDPPLAPYICPKYESSSFTVPMLMRGQRSPLRSTMSVPSNLGPPAAANAAHVPNNAGERHPSCQAGGVTPRSAQLALTRQKTARHENLLSEAEEALRRHITHKTNRLHTEEGPDSSKAFLSALCTLSTESFDRLWAGVLHASISNHPATPPARDAGSRPPDSNENGKSRAALERTQIWEGRLERFAANAEGALIRLVNNYWERLTIGLDEREFHGDQFRADKRLRRLCHHLELRELDQDAELHWLRRALALIRNLRDFEEYLGENGHPLSEGLNQRLRHAYLTEIYAAGSSCSDADVKTAFKEDLRYAVRWMIFIRPFGVGAIIVCGESISKLVCVNVTQSNAIANSECGVLGTRRRAIITEISSGSPHKSSIAVLLTPRPSVISYICRWPT
jgi:hypothetical protein